MTLIVDHREQTAPGVERENTHQPLVVTLTAENDVSRGLLSHSTGGAVVLHSTLNPTPGSTIRVDLRLAGSTEDEFFEVTTTVLVHRVQKLATNVIELSGYWRHAESRGRPEPLREFLQQVAQAQGGIGRVLPPDDTISEKRFVYTFPRPPEPERHPRPAPTHLHPVHPDPPHVSPVPAVAAQPSVSTRPRPAAVPTVRGAERRRSARVVTLKPVIYAIKAARHPGYITNASSHGLFIQTTHEVPIPATVVILAIPSPRGGRVVHIHGRVVHRYTPDELPTGRGFGMEFVMTQDPYKDAEIYRFIDDFLKSL